MTVPSSPWVKLTNVITEFGPDGTTPAPRTLSSYKKSPTGPYVGVSTLTTNIPSTNPVYLHSFGGEAKGSPGVFSTSSGNGTVSIPSGAVSFIIEVWGGGGNGGRGGIALEPSAPPAPASGGGGGGGGYARTPITLGGPISSHWGQTFAYTVGSAGNLSTVTTVTYNGTFTPMKAYGGTPGTNGGGSGCGCPGIGGTSSGGIFIATGFPGCGDTAGPGYPGVSTPYGGAGGRGGIGAPGAGDPGSPGIVRFTWT
jgi:hypothetical protein